MGYFFIADRENFIRMAEHFRAAGLIQLWTKFDEYLHKLPIQTGYFGKSLDKSLDLITSENLTSIFLFWSVMLGLGLLVFIGMEVRDKLMSLVVFHCICFHDSVKLSYRMIKRLVNAFKSVLKLSKYL
jgi:hypothetical protein